LEGYVEIEEKDDAEDTAEVFTWEKTEEEGEDMLEEVVWF